MSLSRPTLGSIEVDGAHSRRGQRVRRGGGHAAGSAIGSIEGARFQQLGVHLFELFDLAGCERHRPRVEPSAGRLRLMTCPFLSDALSAQAFNLINTRITSGDHIGRAVVQSFDELWRAAFKRGDTGLKFAAPTARPGRTGPSNRADLSLSPSARASTR